MFFHKFFQTINSMSTIPLGVTTINFSYSGMSPFCVLRTGADTYRHWCMSETAFKFAYSDDLLTWNYIDYPSQVALGIIYGASAGLSTGDFFSGGVWSPANSWKFDGVTATKPLPCPLPTAMTGGAGNGSYIICVHYGDNKLYKTVDGINWTTISLPTGYSVSASAITFSPVSGAFNVHPWSGTNFMRSTDGGTTWAAIPKPSGVNCRFGASVGDYVLSGENNTTTAAYSTNGGATWSTVTLPIAPTNYNIASNFKSSECFSICNGGTTFYWSKTGNTGTWSSVVVPGISNLASGGYAFLYQGDTVIVLSTTDNKVILYNLGVI